MNTLEAKIYKRAQEVMDEYRDQLKNEKFESKIVICPFFCDGCFDNLVYDTEIGDFTKIQYTVGVGQGMTLEGMSDFSAYYKEVEHREFDIPRNMDN